jgi:hypothetical protein
MPSLLYLEDLPILFKQRSTKVATENWYELFRCNSCDQLWRLDIWDKEQDQFAAKVPSAHDWVEFDTIPAQKELLLKTRGGIGSIQCSWAQCNQTAVKNLLICVDHLYEMGNRR